MPLVADYISSVDVFTVHTVAEDYYYAGSDHSHIIYGTVYDLSLHIQHMTQAVRLMMYYTVQNDFFLFLSIL